MTKEAALVARVPSLTTGERVLVARVTSLTAKEATLVTRATSLMARKAVLVARATSPMSREAVPAAREALLAVKMASCKMNAPSGGPVSQLSERSVAVPAHDKVIERPQSEQFAG